MTLPAAPEAVPQAFADAWNARDPDALAAMFDADASFVNVVGLWWHSREAIREAHAYGLETLFPASRLRVGRAETRPLAPGVAVVTARLRLDGQSAVGGVEAPGMRHTVMTFVVREVEPGGWRCAAAHNTDVVPGMETHVRDASGGLRAADYRSGRVSE